MTHGVPSLPQETTPFLVVRLIFDEFQRSKKLHCFQVVRGRLPKIKRQFSEHYYIKAL
jgi:hypothetical protein